MPRPLGGSQTYSGLVLHGSCMVLWLTNAVLLRWNQSSVGCRLVVLDVVRSSAVSRRMHTKVSCAGCGSDQGGSTKRSCVYQFQRHEHMPRLGILQAQPPNRCVQPTASRARSLLFEGLQLARSRRLTHSTFGTRGSVIVIPFSVWMWRIGLPKRPSCNFRHAEARCAGVVRTPVVLKARCAGVVRRLVVLEAR